MRALTWTADDILASGSDKRAPQHEHTPHAARTCERRSAPLNYNSTDESRERRSVYLRQLACLFLCFRLFPSAVVSFSTLPFSTS
jgi:hypothetical protein